jgi:diguanylate cyclase (GGDEF)-like protein
MTAPRHSVQDDLADLAAHFGFEMAALPKNVQDAFAAVVDALHDAEDLADHDPLAPVLNRRAFHRTLQRALSHVERYGRKSAVLYLDLDDFKSVNDRYGHAAGDAVLRHIARLLLDNVRESDSVGRLGGDEFGLILAEAGPAEAAAKAHALRELIARTPLTFEGVSHPIAASIGWHVLQAPDDVEGAIARADEAMYATKPRLARAG